MCKVVSRYEIVGSFLRPKLLKQARSEYEAGNITKEELKKSKMNQLENLFQNNKLLD